MTLHVGRLDDAERFETKTAVVIIGACLVSEVEIGKASVTVDWIEFERLALGRI